MVWFVHHVQEVDDEEPNDVNVGNAWVQAVHARIYVLQARNHETVLVCLHPFLSTMAPPVVKPCLFPTLFHNHGLAKVWWCSSAGPPLALHYHVAARALRLRFVDVHRELLHHSVGMNTPFGRGGLVFGSGPVHLRSTDHSAAAASTWYGRRFTVDAERSSAYTAPPQQCVRGTQRKEERRPSATRRPVHARACAPPGAPPPPGRDGRRTAGAARA